MSAELGRVRGRHRPPRVVIVEVRPQIQGGRFPVKRTVGDVMQVEADVFTDGHDAIAAALRYRHAHDVGWCEVAMDAVGNDAWRGAFPLPALGEYRYTVVAWVDRFRSWLGEMQKWATAGREVTSELLEGAALLERIAARAHGADRTQLRAAAAFLADREQPLEARVRRAADPALAARVDRHPDRTQATEYARELRVVVNRERARFSAWYEMFPRSAGPDPTRSATFREAAARLPDIAAMGFDVVYLPPIHPIGETNRKGPGNVLRGRSGDPGSPWAIGSAAGGHKGVHSDLGTLEDFAAFREEARRLEMEVALDLAFQCSPDHPYVTEHPQWFLRRPDGTIKYAQNPPKQYQDIYPLDMETEDWEALWAELKSIVLFWIEQGARIFRVDNPHTKPFAFWEWLLAEVKREYPDVIFLSEAFTRPKVMYDLAQRGFDQSYTYFTWRNTKAELAEYFTELTQTDVREYFRPNLFTNTPDILTTYLQTGGRPAFLVRLVLAATLGANYGIYSGFELCESEAVPGTEEYRHSEKYEIRVRDWDAPGNIKAFIQRVNSIRRAAPALQDNWRLWFLPVDNDHLLAYLKSAPDERSHALVVVNLDIHSPQGGHVGLPLETLGIGPTEPFSVHDLLRDERSLWQGEWNAVWLDPSTAPAAIFVLG